MPNIVRLNFFEKLTMAFSQAKYCSPKFRRANLKCLAQGKKIVRLNSVEKLRNVFLMGQIFLAKFLANNFENSCLKAKNCSPKFSRAFLKCIS